MRYISLFSGIEAASVAWEYLGWEPVAFAEFEDFPKAVLKHRYPNVIDLGDVTQITEEQIKALGHIDIIVGGSPCQDLSIAGKRAGMKNDDGTTTRSGLFDEQMRIFEIARKYNGARYCLWENVPGAFSSNNGNDFAYVLGSLVGGSISVPPDRWKNSGVAISGDGRRLVEWRVLDAQYFGVPQRRRRIFIVLDTGAWWSRQPILFEPQSSSGNFEACREEGEGASRGAREGSESSKRIIAPTLTASNNPSRSPQSSEVTQQIFAVMKATAVRTAQTGANGIGVAKDVSHTLDGANGQAVMYENHGNDSRVTRCDDGIAPTLSSRMGTGGGNVPLVMNPESNRGGEKVDDGNRSSQCGDFSGQVPDTELCGRATDLLRGGDMNPRIASGKEVFPTLCSSMGQKQWLGNQEAFSGDYHILEDL